MKKLVAVMLMLLTLVLLVSCTGGGGDEEAPKELTSQDVYEKLTADAVSVDLNGMMQSLKDASGEELFAMGADKINTTLDSAFADVDTLFGEGFEFNGMESWENGIQTEQGTASLEYLGVKGNDFAVSLGNGQTYSGRYDIENKAFYLFYMQDGVVADTMYFDLRSELDAVEEVFVQTWDSLQEQMAGSMGGLGDFEIPKLGVQAMKVEHIINEGDGKFSVSEDYFKDSLEEIYDMFEDILASAGVEGYEEYIAQAKAITDKVVFRWDITTENGELKDSDCSVSVEDENLSMSISTYVEYVGGMQGDQSLNLSVSIPAAKVSVNLAVEVDMTFDEDNTLLGMDAIADMSMTIAGDTTSVAMKYDIDTILNEDNIPVGTTFAVSTICKMNGETMMDVDVSFSMETDMDDDNAPVGVELSMGVDANMYGTTMGMDFAVNASLLTDKESNPYGVDFTLTAGAEMQGERIFGVDFAMDAALLSDEEGNRCGVDLGLAANAEVYGEEMLDAEFDFLVDLSKLDDANATILDIDMSVKMPAMSGGYDYDTSYNEGLSVVSALANYQTSITTDEQYDYTISTVIGEGANAINASVNVKFTDISENQHRMEITVENERIVVYFGTVAENFPALNEDALADVIAELEAAREDGSYVSWILTVIGGEADEPIETPDSGSMYW